VRPCLPCYPLPNGSKSGWNRGEQSRFNFFIPRPCLPCYTLQNSSLKRCNVPSSIISIIIPATSLTERSFFTLYYVIARTRMKKLEVRLSILTTDSKDTKFCIVRAACSHYRFTLYYFKRAWIPNLCCHYKWSIVN